MMDETGACSNHLNMHNLIHLIVGGDMGDPLTAANDPFFFLHHGFIDYIFEVWLQTWPTLSEGGQRPNRYSPMIGSLPGHNGIDCCGSIFPFAGVYEMYSCASNLGFSYEGLTSCSVCKPCIDQNQVMSYGAQVAVLTILIILIGLIVGACSVVFYRCWKSRPLGNRSGYGSVN
jgi:hypothetical protein